MRRSVEALTFVRPDGSSNVEEAVINTLMEVIKPAGAMGIPGVYTNLDPGAPTELNKKGLMALAFPQPG